jgi:hypothetical protein
MCNIVLNPFAVSNFVSKNGVFCAVLLCVMCYILSGIGRDRTV